MTENEADNNAELEGDNEDKLDVEREVARYNNCFVCGPDNPSGLNLKFVFDGKVARTEYTPSNAHEGYKGILHGGIIATILDEVMIKAALAQGITCVTAQMDIRFKAPVMLEKKVFFTAEIIEIKGRIITTTGKALDHGGHTLAESTGKYMTVSEELEQQLKQSLSE
jgi:uncharacterized protein (TIGR00369 family)